MRRLLTLLAATVMLAASLPAEAYTAAEEKLFAQNMYHEARSGGREGMIAVGWVVLNRVKDKGFPGTITKVVHQGGPKPPCEWGWTCDRRRNQPAEGKLWREAQQIARQMLGRNRPADPTGGALWMHETRLSPAYTNGLHKTATIGGNVFYRR